jgi:transcriptional regulator GlxA family with amidase domain
MMSVRHLTRIFRQTIGITVNDYITLIRRETAQTLLNNPEYTVERVAEICGLQSVRHLRRILMEK